MIVEASGYKNWGHTNRMKFNTGKPVYSDGEMKRMERNLGIQEFGLIDVGRFSKDTPVLPISGG